MSVQPNTAVLSFATAPSGLSVSIDGTAQATPFTRTVIVGSQHSIGVTTPQTLGASTYSFASWSDGGAAVHTITSPATATTYTATFNLVSTTRTFNPLANSEVRQAKASSNFGTQTTMRDRTGSSSRSART